MDKDKPLTGPPGPPALPTDAGQIIINGDVIINELRGIIADLQWQNVVLKAQLAEYQGAEKGGKPALLPPEDG
jgi:hypothetical protein